MHRWTSAAALLIASTLILSCDRRDTTPLPTTVPAPESNRPTTQSLVTGPRQKLALGPLPLLISAPEPWKVESLGSSGITILSGPTPTGEIHVNLANRPSVHPEQLDAMEAAGKEEMAAHPDTVTISVRSLNGLKILEKHSIDRPASLAVKDENGATLRQPAFATWIVRVFIPNGQSYRSYELNFIGLTQRQFEADKEFLQGILNTLQLDPALFGPEK